MLARMREAVCKIWEIAKVLDSKGIGNTIPFIPEEGNIRYAMKGETIVMLYDIVGVDRRQNEKQIEYLRYVLHAPVKYEEQDSYKQWIRNDTVIRNNPMLPYFAMIDRKMGSDLAELYLEFQALMVIGYMKCCDKISAEMGMRYMTYMKNAIVLSEKALGKTINFDPLKLIDADMREDVGNLYKFIQQFETKNIPYENNLNALDNLLNGGKNIGCENSERNYREFYGNIEALVLGEDCETVEDEEESQEIICDEQIQPKGELIDELYSLIGLEEVKTQIHSMFHLMQMKKECEKRGIKRQPMSYHMVFSGNPGTGKTTVARLIAGIYYSMGLLSKGHVIEVGRSDLVAGYVGQTALKVREVLEKAKGGVLFIDEAYSLTSHSANDYGHEAIETLLKGLEENREDLVVIAAGYPELMQEFLDSNPGISSRFSKTIYFADYSSEELTQIFERFCAENSIHVDKKVLACVRRYFEGEVVHKNKNFGNARMVRNYFEAALLNQANRLASKERITDTMICSFIKDDLPKKFFVEN